MKIAIAIIHGIGSQAPGFSQDMQEALMEQYEAFGDNYHHSDLIFKEIFWADVLKNQQQLLYKRIDYRNHLRFEETRQFLIDYLGDAVAYQPLSHKQNHAEQIEVYRLIHKRIDDVLQDFAEHPNIDAAKTPLVLIGHSLGTVILSNYIWDRQNNASQDSNIEQCKTLVGLLTFGSPIALWTLRYKSFGTPITFPGSELPEHLAAKARWYNFYDKDDVIACPLKQLNEAYNKIVSQDIEVNVGSLLTSWNPLSHASYWDDDDMIEPIAGFLRDLQ